MFRRITVFECLYCKNICRTKNAVKKCVKNCKLQKEKQQRQEEIAHKFEILKHEVRLNSTSIEDAIRRMKKIAKEVWGLTITITEYPNTLSTYANTHDAPVGIKVEWCNERTQRFPAFTGRWKGKIRGRVPYIFKKLDCGFKRELKAETIEDLFAGFHFSTGSCGKDFDMSGHIYLQDFPNIKVDTNMVNKS